MSLATAKAFSIFDLNFGETKNRYSFVFVDFE